MMSEKKMLNKNGKKIRPIYNIVKSLLFFINYLKIGTFPNQEHYYPNL